MNHFRSALRPANAALVLVFACTVASCQTTPAQTEAPPTRSSERSGTHIWIERPWEMRYFLMVTGDWRIAKEGAIRRNARPGKISFSWEQLFDPIVEFPSTKPHARPRDALSVITIEFDKQGWVTTPHTHKGTLRGRLNRLSYITLSTGDDPQDARYNLGEWFLGLGDTSTDWAPGLCVLKNIPTPFAKTDEYYLYGPKFKLDEFSTTFGCREWAYQLYDPDRPYIDVTTYIPKSIDKDGPGTYIREFIGWARFDDKKPVIGKDENQWYCLHDCPGGDKPGPIGNINAWAAKNGWAVPKRPTRVPTFPDPPAIAGTYPK